MAEDGADAPHETIREEEYGKGDCYGGLNVGTTFQMSEMAYLSPLHRSLGISLLI